MKPIRWVGVCAVLVMATGILTIALSYLFRNSGSEKQLIGSWVGEGSSRSSLAMRFDQKSQSTSPSTLDASPLLQTSIQATFRGDHTMTMSWSSDGDGIHFSFEIPDPKQPGDVGRWKVVRNDGDAIVLRIIHPEHSAAPEWKVEFRGTDEFLATPTDPSQEANPLRFRRRR